MAQSPSGIRGVVGSALGARSTAWVDQGFVDEMVLPFEAKCIKPHIM